MSTARLLAIAYALLLTTSGCAGPWASPRAEAPPPLSKPDADKALKHYDDMRDAAQLQAAERRLKRGDSAGAKVLVQAILTRNPQHVAATNLLDRANGCGERVADIATSEPEAVAESPPDGSFESATNHGIDANDSSEELFDGGLAALEAGKSHDAIACFERAIEASPDDWRPGVRAAIALLRNGDAAGAIALVEPVARNFPNVAAPRRALGAAQLQQGDVEAAQASLSMAVRLDNADALAYFLLSRAERSLGRQQAAEAALARALLLDPQLGQR